MNLENFSLNLFSKINKRNYTNVFVISPFSVITDLLIILIGATGKTYNELINMLGIPNFERSQMIQSIMEWLTTVNKIKSVNIFNGVYFNKDYNIKPEFINLLERKFSCHVYGFEKNTTHNLVSDINNQISKSTNGKINNMLTNEDDITNTNLLLLNTTYFKSDWKYKFDKNKTRHVKFQNSGDSFDIEMMHKNGMFRYVNKSRYEMCEIPYEDENITLYVVLPRQQTIDDDVMDWFDIEESVKCICSKQVEYVLIGLPKFSSTFSTELTDIIKQLGCTELFDNRANLSLISNDIHVSKIIHRCIIEFKEEGTEAAAATVVTTKCITKDSETRFICDRPFIYFIREKKNQ